MSILGGAFFIMDHLPGQLLVAAPPETVPGLLGKTHAELHNIDPDPLIKTRRFSCPQYPVRRWQGHRCTGLARYWDLVADLYLAAYRTHRSLDDTNLDYYRVRPCVMALVQGAEGQKVWQHPLIVRDLLATILDITGIQITMPAQSNPQK
jgi:hypothetical protein